jgi:hypothetical protein
MIAMTDFSHIPDGDYCTESPACQQPQQEPKLTFRAILSGMICPNV